MKKTGNNPYPMAESVRKAYKKGQTEEEMEPIVLCDADGSPLGRIQNGDEVIFYDIRGEREIELTSAFTDPEFSHFPVQPDLRTGWTTMIEYLGDLDVRVAFPPQGKIENSLAEVISKNGLQQAKISESEKTIHVSYFLNGKTEELFPGEERIVINSPENAGNYETTPEMSAKDVADKTISILKEKKADFIVTNFCNVDVLGHTENKDAILKAIHTVDRETGRVLRAAQESGYTAVITADHGTVERYYYPDGSIDTGHTISDVPLIIVPGEDGNTRGRKIPGKIKPAGNGALSDIAPTLLDLMGIPVPGSMTGKSLLAGRPEQDVNKNVILIILDGWGHNPDTKGNLIKEADTPVFDSLVKRFGMSTLKASGRAVGLPEKIVGNSEVGHLHIGSGRIMPSDKVRIADALEDRSFFTNEAFLTAMRNVREKKTALHILGIVSFFSSHGSIDYALALIEMAKKQKVKKLYIHGLLGRRGERPESGAYYVQQMEETCRKLGTGRVVSVIGRFWALDREYNWDRIEKTYRMLVHGEGEKALIKTDR